MTKQEQIEEMAKIVDEMYNVYTTTADDIADGLYNAGYRKIDDLKAEKKQLKTECALLDDELRIARQDTIDVLNKLKAENEELSKVVSSKVYDLIDNTKEIADAREAWEQQAKIEVLNELKERIPLAMSKQYVCAQIDEMIEELAK